MESEKSNRHPDEHSEPLIGNEKIVAGGQEYVVEQFIDIGQVDKVWKVTLPNGESAALKKPKTPGHLQFFQDEARRLDQLKKSKQGNVAVPQIIKDSSKEPDDPFLLVEWVDGEKISIYDFSFDQARRLSRNLINFIQRAFFHYVIMTDALKPGSIIFNEETEIAYIIDWNVCGKRPDDFKNITLPLLARTMAKLFKIEVPALTLEQRGFDFSLKRFYGEEWQVLPMSIKLFICDLTRSHGVVDRDYGDKKELDVNQSIRSLVRRSDNVFNEQFLASREELQKAGESERLALINAYDIACLKGHEMVEEDEAAYRQAVYEVIASCLDQKKWPFGDDSDEKHIGLEFVQMFANWAFERFPDDRFIRWNWLLQKLSKNGDYYKVIVGLLISGDQSVVRQEEGIVFDVGSIKNGYPNSKGKFRKLLEEGSSDRHESSMAKEIAELMIAEMGFLAGDIDVDENKILILWEAILEKEFFEYKKKDEMSSWVGKLPEENKDREKRIKAWADYEELCLKLIGNPNVRKSVSRRESGEMDSVVWFNGIGEDIDARRATQQKLVLMMMRCLSAVEQALGIPIEDLYKKEKGDNSRFIHLEQAIAKAMKKIRLNKSIGVLDVIDLLALFNNTVLVLTEGEPKTYETCFGKHGDFIHSRAGMEPNCKFLLPHRTDEGKIEGWGFQSANN